MNLELLKTAFSQNNLKSHSKFVLSVFCCYSNPGTNKVLLSKNKICELTSLNKKTVDRAIKILIENKMIVDTGRKGGHTNTIKEYEIFIEFKENKIKTKNKVKRNFSEINRLKSIISLTKLYGYQCCYCSSIDNLEIDHKIPVSKNGTNFIDNLQLLCKKCNRIKSDT